ncbi:MAG: glycosyltransferase [Candidatus Delongbacteria bacterium]
MLSVLIPLFDGVRTLAACLADWRAQVGVELELVVVDNGSSDDSLALATELTARPGAPVRVFREATPGQSAATNRAAREARGEWLLLSAQDMRVPADLARRHLEAHARHARPGELLALQGHIAYPPAALATPFMRCLVEETAFQFAFEQAGNLLDADPTVCYAPHLSLHAAVYRRLGGFDEDFPYGWQDTDLGCRLRAAGGRLVYEPGLVAWHDHPVEGRAYCRRMETVGRDLPRFVDKQPGVLDLERIRQGVGVHFLQGGRLASAAQRLLRVAEEHPGALLPPLEVEEVRHDPVHAAWVILLKYHFHKGVHDGGRRHWGADCWRGLGGRI